MKKHICKESTTCRCYQLALEPNENCPIHGYPYPPRCGECGKFIKRLDIFEKALYNENEDKEKEGMENKFDGELFDGVPMVKLELKLIYNNLQGYNVLIMENIKTGEITSIMIKKKDEEAKKLILWNRKT